MCQAAPAVAPPSPAADDVAAAASGPPAGNGKLAWGPRALAALLAPLAAASLQGCEAVGHPTANWELKPSYVATFAYLPSQTKRPAGQYQPSALDAVLGSCSLVGPSQVPKEKQCSGNGYCKAWPGAQDEVGALSFCECDLGWADPECRTRRKSQSVAYLLSVFAGFLGVDHFYLGEYYSGLIKLGTLGGFGAWWVVDIVRIGSSPVYSSGGFRLAADLPHWLYVGSVIPLFALLGYLFFVWAAPAATKQRRLKKAMLQAEVDFFKTRSATADIDPMHSVGMPTKASYSVPLPMGFNYGTMIPEEVRRAATGNPHASYSVFNDPSALGGLGAAPAYQQAQMAQTPSWATAMANPAEGGASPMTVAEAGGTPVPTPPGSPALAAAQSAAEAAAAEAQ